MREAQLEPDDELPPFRTRACAICARRSNGRGRGFGRPDRPQTEGLDYQIAQVYAVRGEKEKAFEWLQIAFDNHDTGMLALLVDPLLRSLRDDPRYKALVAKMNFPATLMSEKPSFFAELKRRNVYKVAVAYAIVGWLDSSDRDAGLSIPRDSKLGRAIGDRLGRDRISDRAHYRLGI